MPADTSVKFLYSGLTGAPVNSSNTPGALIAILDAALVNGFGAGTVDSLVVASNTATVTRAAGHPFEIGTVALIEGATPSGLNGEKRVLSVTTTTYTFETSGIADQTATGTITHKTAPLGWEKVFSGTNKAAYRSSDPLSTRCFLRVDDAYTAHARVRGYKDMSDIDTGIDSFPALAITDNTYNWPRANGGTYEWAICGDKKRFYFFLRASSSTSALTHYFGDFIPYRSADPYGCVLTGVNLTSWGGSESSYAESFPYGGSGAGGWAPKNVTGVGGPSLMRRLTNALLYNNQWSGTSGFVFPNTADNSILLAEMFAADITPGNMRGRYPGFFYLYQDVRSALTHLSRIQGVIGYPGRTFRVINNANSSIYLFDTSGPWE